LHKTKNNRNFAPDNRNQVTDVKEALASAYAQRAMLMLDAARMYEFLPNDAVSSVNEAGNDVMGLTFPTVTARQDSTAVRHNREVLAAYILNDLNRADDAISQTTASGNKLLASQAVVSGLKARLYMWTEDYAQALTWATKAIQLSGATPLTRDQWLSTTQGFNDRSMPAWMWAFQFTADSPLVAMGEDLSPEYFMDGGGQYISVPAGTTTQVDFVVPDITKTYRVILFCRNRYYPSQYYYWYNYVSPNLWWRSIGMGTYTEDIICSLFGVEDVTYEVEVEENMTTPGLFRLKNPYGAAFPYNEPGDWDASRDYYLEIHAEDPTAVYIEEQELGLDWNYGMFRIISYAAYYMQVGYDKEIIKANDFFGTLTDGVITFPKANSFLVAMPSIQDGDWSYSGNRNGGFRLVLPAEPDYPTASKRMPRNLPPTNKQGINYRLVPIDDRME